MAGLERRGWWWRRGRRGEEVVAEAEEVPEVELAGVEAEEEARAARSTAQSGGRRRLPSRRRGSRRLASRKRPDVRAGREAAGHVDPVRAVVRRPERSSGKAREDVAGRVHRECVDVTRVQALRRPGIPVVRRAEDPAARSELRHRPCEYVAVRGDRERGHVCRSQPVVDEIPVLAVVGRPVDTGAAAGGSGEESARGIDRQRDDVPARQACDRRAPSCRRHPWTGTRLRSGTCPRTRGRSGR